MQKKLNSYKVIFYIYHTAIIIRALWKLSWKLHCNVFEFISMSSIIETRERIKKKKKLRLKFPHTYIGYKVKITFGFFFISYKF